MKVSHIHVPDKLNKGDAAVTEAAQEQIIKHLGAQNIHDFSILDLKENDEAVLSKINDSNLVIIGGGGIFYRGFLPYNKQFIQKIEPPIAILSAGYINEMGAPDLSPEEKDSILALTTSSAKISVRDYATEQFLRQIGFDKEISVIGDIAISLSEGDFSIYDKENPNIGFNLNYSGWLDFGKHKENILKSYSFVIEFLKEELNAEIFYLVHHPSENEIAKELIRHDIKIIDLPPRQQKHFYRNLDFVIGMLLHTAILSFSVNTPFLNLAYDLKNQAFADFIGCPELIIDPQFLTPERFLEKVAMIIENESAYREKFEKLNEEIKVKQEVFFKSLLTIC